MDAHSDTARLGPFREGVILRRDSLHDRQAAAHRTLCVVLLGKRVTEIHHRSVTIFLGEVAAETADHLFDAQLASGIRRSVVPFFGIQA